MTFPSFETEEECRTYLESLRWPLGVESPFDEFSKVYSCKGEKYRCRNTGKYFNVRTGTLLSKSRLSLNQWMQLLNDNLKSNLNPKQIASDYDITLKSAYNIYHKLKKLSAEESQLPSVNTSEQFTMADWLFQLKN